MDNFYSFQNFLSLFFKCHNFKGVFFQSQPQINDSWEDRGSDYDSS